jgi:hypothetical protein
MSKAKISVREMVQDIQAGMDKDTLAEKYRLTFETFENILEQLLQSDLITHLQFSELMRPSATQMTRAFDKTRKTIKESD